jgi:predicted AAA+ superfamily ATPase
VDFLRATLRSLASTVTNPLTPEERRLLELVNKDDLTIEEAEELYRLARKVFDEYIDKTPDAVAALFYAIIKRVEAYEKHGG